ncbi:hypothetical protein GQ43DRAFT_479702 [Delitschia confertaspora ATCC 74209]|uniref:Uncharacterized protein n=1 Tax=Delitschia confertaspora ATCC 74209 TaxID=1513339 RepID=A0A9P4JQS3_9PLEO|nr:hypothetical protein GQ43DRAFT_479702 [Delitschia confertaspora ATCC 74209]
MGLSRLSLLLSLYTIARAAEGPCNVGPLDCYEVMNASTCFASIDMGPGSLNPKAQVLQCVNEGDAAAAQEVICRCWGCDSALEGWVKSNNICP